MAPSKSHMKFVEIGTSESGRTLVVQVFNRMNGVSLGMIRWMAGWRRYVFEANPGMVFDADCHEELAHELQRMTKTHKSKRLATSQAQGI